MTANTITARGASGKIYECQIFSIGTEFYVNPGVYIFMKLAMNGNWDPIYIGEAQDFNDRLYKNLRQHHRLECIDRYAATHVALIKVAGGKNARTAIETDLRNAYDPPCNRQ